MPRTDLLSLSPEALAALSTRGKVNEAKGDLDSGRVTGTVEEGPDGAVVVVWSDKLRSEVPAGATLKAGKCSCNPIGTCKHLIRLVLLYQRQTPTEPAAPAAPWDPGLISDDELAKHFKPAALAKIRKQLDSGILAEVMRATRPVARFHLPVCTVRFLLPGDLRYTRCDCAKPVPCDHVPLAVWAFRQLDSAKRAGIVALGAGAEAVPTELLDEIDAALEDYVTQGISGAGKGLIDRLARLEERCRKADLVWPAEIVAELLAEQESYTRHDARFDPGRVAARLGELILRVDAIRRPPADLPQLLIRGSSGDRVVEMSYGEFRGLGCGVEIGRKSVEITAFLYDTKGAGIVTMTKEIAETDDGEEKAWRNFGALGRRSAIKATSFFTLGAGELGIQSPKRSAAGALVPGRTNAEVRVARGFPWEEIQPPVYVEELAELEDYLATLPPSALRPPRLGEDFHVLRIMQVDQARFDAATQTIQARLIDASGKAARLLHPWTSRGKSGAEALLTRLMSFGEKCKPVFVSGMVTRAVDGLVIHPVGLVYEEDGTRHLLQPWIEQKAGQAEEEETAVEVSGDRDPVREAIGRVQQRVGELCVVGLSRSDPTLAKTWRELVRQIEAVGFSRFSVRIDALTTSLEQRQHTLRWEPGSAARLLLELAGLTRLAQDVTT